MPSEDKSLVFDVRKADANYKPFPTFKAWKKQAQIDEIRWQRYSAKLEALKGADDSNFTKVREAIELATAIDTGAIEGLYETDRGFTYSVAFESAVWQSVVESAKGEEVRAMIESHLHAFEFVLDFATKNAEIASAWIRQLHAEICKEQDTYQAFTEIGIQNLPLPKGKYKTLPNHVRNQNDQIHSYAPVDLVSSEMIRFCHELNGQDFLTSHPVLQSSYCHYCFVAIHPFADGNGRVARALASVYFYRDYSIPLLIFADSRSKYYEVLEHADAADYRPFMDFISDIGLSSLQLFSDSFSAGRMTEIDESISSIQNLYVTKGGYSHEEVDKAASDLVRIFREELTAQIALIPKTDKIKAGIKGASNVSSPNPQTYRFPLKGAMGCALTLATPAPASAHITKTYSVQVPRDCDKGDDIVLRESKIEGDADVFEARATDLIPNITATLRLRIKLKVVHIIKMGLQELASKAQAQLVR